MSRLVTIGPASLPVSNLVLTADDARKLGALLIAKANEYDRAHRKDGRA